jgi:hypothetical protein
MFVGDAFDLRIRNRSVRFSVKMYFVRLHNNEAPLLGNRKTAVSAGQTWQEERWED